MNELSAPIKVADVIAVIASMKEPSPGPPVFKRSRFADMAEDHPSLPMNDPINPILVSALASMKESSPGLWCPPQHLAGYPRRGHHPVMQFAVVERSTCLQG